MENKKIGAGVGVLVIKNKKILLGKRNEDPKKADSIFHGEGSWTMPGGKIDFQEKIEKAAKRELFEETGIKATSSDIQVFCLNEEIIKEAHFITIGLIFKNCTQEPKVKEPEEITEWKWFSLNDLPKKIYPPSKKILNNFKQKQLFISNNK